MREAAPTPARRRPARAAAALALLLAGCAGGADGPGGAEADRAAGAESAPPAATSALGGYLAARHARRSDDMAAAYVYFRRALEDDPANPELLEGALVAALSRRDMAAAAPVAERILAMTPGASLPRVALATAAAAAGDFPAALREIDALARRGGERHAAALLRAWARAGREDFDGALAALAPLAGRSAYAGAHDYHSGLIADLAGRPDAAGSGFAGALGAVGGGALRVVLAAGGFHWRAGRADEARAIYDAFLDRNPDTLFLDAAYRGLDSGAPAPPPLAADAREGFAEALYSIAAALFRENARETPLVHAQLCLAARPGHDACRMLAGDAHARAGRFADALAAYDAAAADSPLKWALRLRAADMLAELGRVDAAARRLRAMARERPERADPLIALADAMLREERYEEAARAYDRALARIPTLEDRHWPLLYARGMSLERSKRWDRAEKDFLRALEMAPDQPLVLNYLGYSWIELGRHYDRARGMIEKAVEQRPNDGFIVDSLGWVLYRLGEYADAAKHLERAAALRPDDPVILDHFGDGLWRVGRRNEARFQWRRALAFDPEPELEAAVREKLANGLPPAPEAPPGGAEDL